MGKVFGTPPNLERQYLKGIIQIVWLLPLVITSYQKLFFPVWQQMIVSDKHAHD